MVQLPSQTPNSTVRLTSKPQVAALSGTEVAILSLFRPARVWTTGSFPVPWQPDRQSIFAFVTDKAQTGGSPTLPDSEEFEKVQPKGSAPGAYDSLSSPADDATQIARRIGLAIKAVLDQPVWTHITVLYELLTEQTAVTIGDALAQDIREDPSIDIGKLQAFFQWIARNAPDREPVKAAIIILGLIDDESNRELFLDLGRHDEFTLYCGLALQEWPDTAEEDLWTLARNTVGWGRIHAIRMLSGTNNPDIKRWLVRGGYRNTAGYKHLAYVAATTGSLVTELRSSHVDDELLDAAAEILFALIVDEDTRHIDDYTDAPSTIQLFLDYAALRGPSLTQLLTVAELHTYLVDGNVTLRSEVKAHWGNQALMETIEKVKKILKSEKSLAVMNAGLSAVSLEWYFAARRVALEIGADTWDRTWTRHTETEDELWYELMMTDDPARIERVIDLATKTLPLDRVASGPALEALLDGGHEPHLSVQFIVKDLVRFPGKGWPVICAALQSPAIDNRLAAVDALETWARGLWTAEMTETVERAREAEPSEDVRSRLDTLLANAANDNAD